MISRALIEQNRLNRCSPCGLLLKWGINPSTSLKCTATDSGKLLSAGLFARTPPAKFTLWESAYQKSLVSHLQWLLTQLCLTKSNTMSRDKVGKRFGGCNNLIWNGFPYGVVTRECQEQSLCILEIPLEEAIIAVKLQTHQSWHISPQSWRLTAFDVRASGCGELPYFVCAPAGWD